MAGVTPLMEGSPDGFPPPATRARFVESADSGICSTGSTTLSSMAGRDCTSTMVTARAPPRNRAAASAGRTVADSPMRCAGSAVSISSRSRLNARCAPRLVPAMAWISSTMTVRTVDRMRRALEVSSRYNDSGVVTRMSGGCEAMARRSCAVVSPLRVATRIDGGLRPMALHWAAMPARGVSRLRATSTPSAFNGEIYSTLTPLAGLREREPPASPASGARFISRSMAYRNAESVLPEPVGAMTSASSPFAITGQAWRCAAVSPCANACLNHAPVGSENRSRHSYICSIMAMCRDGFNRPARRQLRRPTDRAYRGMSTWPDANACRTSQANRLSISCHRRTGRSTGAASRPHRAGPSPCRPVP